MQQTETRNANPPPPARRALSPLAALTVVLLMLIAGAVFVTARSRSRPHVASNDAARAQVAALETQVLSDFNELMALKDRAFEKRDLSLLMDVYVDEGPAGTRATQGLQDLVENAVMDESRFEVLKVALVSLTATDAVIERVDRFYPCFRTERGKDVTQAEGVIRERVLYTLRKEDGKWQVYDVRPLDHRLVLAEESSCGVR